jgi:hypothetical protein
MQMVSVLDAAKTVTPDIKNIATIPATKALIYQQPEL